MAGTVIADNLQAASTSTLVIKNGVANTPPTIQDSAGTEIGTFCRAWVNFNGTGTVAIRSSFNVTSITDGGTGTYTVNFTNAMPDANYCIQGWAGGSSVAGGLSANVSQNASNTTFTTTAVGIFVRDEGTGGTDENIVCVSIFR
jgi:hypothetical protein